MGRELNGYGRRNEKQTNAVQWRKMWLGHFYYSINPINEKIKAIWDTVGKIHLDLHNLGTEVMQNIKDNNKDLAVSNSLKGKRVSEEVLSKLTEMKEISHQLTKKQEFIF